MRRLSSQLNSLLNSKHPDPHTQEKDTNRLVVEITRLTEEQNNLVAGKESYHQGSSMHKQKIQQQWDEDDNSADDSYMAAHELAYEYQST